MSGLAIFTLFHVALSLAGIASGFVALSGMIQGKPFDRWTTLFLATTVATSVTGFFFPFHGMTPGIVLGVLSLLVLAVSLYALYALYARPLAGPWRKAYAISATVAQYFNVFVLIAQSFQKIPFLQALSPTGGGPVFAVAQGVTLLAFLVLGYLVTTQFGRRTTLT